MSEKYCAFLRGINVNGVSIKMEDLKESFVRMGYPDAKTVIATGNIVFTLVGKNNHPRKTISNIEKELSEKFSYDAHVILRSYKEIRNILFDAETINVPEGWHNYLLLFDDKELLAELKEQFEHATKEPQEKLIMRESGTFWVVPKGSTLKSEFGSKVLGNKKYKSSLTSRNINTIQKIYRAMI
jgi:uncharacterized protein (DUF1697 family)